jgi:hypothetical protein
MQIDAESNATLGNSGLQTFIVVVRMFASSTPASFGKGKFCADASSWVLEGDSPNGRLKSREANTDSLTGQCDTMTHHVTPYPLAQHARKEAATYAGASEAVD